MNVNKNEGSKRKNSDDYTKFEHRVTKVEVTQEMIWESIKEIKSTLLDFKREMNQRFDKIEERMDRLDGRMDRIDSRMDRLDNRLWSLVFFMFAGFGSIIGVVAHGFHWI